MNTNQSVMLYYLARSRDEHIARDSLSPMAMARREARAAGRGRSRRQARGWWRR